MLTRRIKVQLAVFAVVALVAGGIMAVGYIKMPATMFGAGYYTVTVELPAAGGLYPSGNVTYRGTEVGRVKDLHVTKTGVAAQLSLKSGIAIPSDLDAEVHSQSAIGEQFVALLPRGGTSPPLKNGDVIPVSRAKVPPDINSLLDATNRGLEVIPRDNLKTAIDEAYTAVGGLGPEISRLVRGSTALAIDARANLDSLTALIDQSAPVLDSQTDTGEAIQAWAAHVATITDQLKTHDTAVAGVLHNGGPAADEARALLDRLQPAVPLLLANLVSINKVAIAYNASIEQVLVIVPQGTALMGAAIVPNMNTKQDYKGLNMDFNLNMNLPPPCTTGYLPANQMRSPVFTDHPDRTADDLYCRIPQDSMWNARGARNYPCMTVPGKRAPTVKMCESDEQYVPLNDGLNWKGDPNATLSGQDVPQGPPGTPPVEVPAPSAPPPPGPQPTPTAVAEYDPATGTYVGPDGHVYTQSDLAQSTPKEKTWQTMLVPPAGN